MSKKINFYFYSILIVIASMPYIDQFSNISIGLLVFSWIYCLSNNELRSKWLKEIKANKIALLMTLLALMYAFSSFLHYEKYTNTDQLLKALEKDASLIIFPLVFGLIPILSKKRIKTVIDSYVLSILASAVIVLLAALVTTIKSGSWQYINPVNSVIENNFMYHRLASFIGMHAVYYAEYILFAVVITIRSSFSNWRNWNKLRKYLSLFLIAFFIVMLFLLKSISINVAFLLVIFILIARPFQNFSQRLTKPQLAVALSLILVVCGVFSYRIIDKFEYKSSFLKYDFEENGGGDWNALSLRKAKWDVAADAISDHWLYGTGPGLIYDVLDQYYAKFDFKYALSLHYNPHNQFIHTFLEIGVIGFVLISTLFIMGFLLCFSKQDVVLLCFLISFSIFSLAESTFVISKGIVFFSFIMCFLTYLPEKTVYYLGND